MKLGHYIAFFIGAAVGAAVMYKHSEQKWREISDEKIDAIRHSKKKNKKKEKENTKEEKQPEPAKSQAEVKPQDTYVNSSLNKDESTDDWTKKYVKYVDILKDNKYNNDLSYTPEPGMIISMTEQEYSDLKESEPDVWTDQTLYYYAKDGVVTDADYDPISDYRAILGYQFDNFDEDDISYVRNNDTKEIFIIHYKNLHFNSSMDLSDDNA